ncbi:MAG: metallophosphoesterase [Prevotella sp.]|nr:metallophosphoesterase [Prevotella sp.]
MAALLSVASAKGQTPGQWELLKGNVNLYLVNDMGRNGYYDQKPIAELMGTMAETIGPEAIIAAGDIHHFNGVASVNDPLWTTNYEHIYSHPELMLDWFPILGNHEYRGNTQAVLDYAKVSRRWMMPARYYTKVFNKKNVSVRIVFLDTTPLIDRYREETDKYPDAVKQDVQKELDWLDQTLRQAKEDWVIVVGHHPIYAETSKAEYERTDMQKRVMPILHRYKNVSIYACGHIHNFQHIQMKGDPIDYVVNSAGALSRKVKPIEGTVFCSGEPGFSVIAATQKQLKLHMIDKQGRVLHTVTKQK